MTYGNFEVERHRAAPRWRSRLAWAALGALVGYLVAQAVPRFLVHC